MTPDEFRAIRVKRYRSQFHASLDLGVSATKVSLIESGKSEVPADVENRLLVLEGKLGELCPKCTVNRVTVDWCDGPCCGACHIQALRQAGAAKASESLASSQRSSSQSGGLQQPVRPVSNGRASQPSNYSNAVTEGE